MPGTQTLVKSFINTAIILFSGVTAHFFACGSFISFPQFLICFFAITFLTSLISIMNLNFKFQMFTVVLTQLAAHYLLGAGEVGKDGMASSQMAGMTMPHMLSPHLMLLTHFSAAILAIAFLRNNEKFWELPSRISQTINPLFSQPPLFTYFKSAKVQLSQYLNFKYSHRFLIEATSRIPAPPNYLY